jgi:hypothetical protein
MDNIAGNNVSHKKCSMECHAAMMRAAPGERMIETADLINILTSEPPSPAATSDQALFPKSRTSEDVSLDDDHTALHWCSPSKWQFPAE